MVSRLLGVLCLLVVVTAASPGTAQVLSEEEYHRNITIHQRRPFLEGNRVELTAGGSQEIAAWSADRVKCWKRIYKGLGELAGVRIRPRALTLTLWARLCLSDLFIHGIGGAKYDRITDQLIRCYFGIEPPELFVRALAALLRLVVGGLQLGESTVVLVAQPVMFPQLGQQGVQPVPAPEGVLLPGGQAASQLGLVGAQGLQRGPLQVQGASLLLGASSQGGQFLGTPGRFLVQTFALGVQRLALVGAYGGGLLGRTEPALQIDHGHSLYDYGMQELCKAPVHAEHLSRNIGGLGRG